MVGDDSSYFVALAPCRRRDVYGGIPFIKFKANAVHFLEKLGRTVGPGTLSTNQVHALKHDMT